MSEPPNPPDTSVDGAGHPDYPDRVGPRPLQRPPADPTAAAVFGRPAGVDGAFAAPPGGSLGSRTAFSELRMAPPPPEALATAFGRPEGSTEVLQRPPLAANPDEDGAEELLWSSENGA